MQKSYFDTLTFNSIKGVAVIILFVLHFFASSDLWLPAFRIPSFQIFEKYFCYSANMCVAIFAFITGYGFWFSAFKTLSHSFHKAVKVLCVYWEIYLIFFGIAVATGMYTDFSIEKIGLSLIGLDSDNIVGDIIAFHWYLAFYLAVLFLLPVLHYFLNRRKNILLDIFYLLFLPLFVFSFLGNLTSSFFGLKRFFVDLVLWFPSVGVGYITARYAIFEKFDDVFYSVFKNKEQWFRFIISIFFVMLTMCGMYRHPGVVFSLKLSWILPVVLNMSVFYVLFFTYALTVFLKIVHSTRIQTLLSVLGKHSLCMWLFNGIFFNVFKPYTQPILLYPENALLILVWGLFICFMLTKLLLSFNNLVIKRNR